MTLATRLDKQPPADPDTGRELGWDHGRHGLTPGAGLLAAHPALRDGWTAARHCFGSRTQAAPAQVQQWLGLRIDAWLSGLHFDTLAVSPRYLAQLAASHCPVTREPLLQAAGTAHLPGLTTIERIREDAGYAAGNLASLSRLAAAAKTGLDCEDALERMRRIDASGRGRSQGMNALQWARLAVLLSFVTPLPHERASSLPLLTLPPNRLHLLNPVQGLQALLTMQLLRTGWSQRIPAFEALLPHTALRRDLRSFCSVLMPKVLASRPGTPPGWRRALEDAWCQPKVQQHWRRFALALDSAQCQQLLERSVAQGLCAQQARTFPADEACDGWHPPDPHHGSGALVRQLQRGMPASHTS